MENNPTLAVVIPVYNEEKHITVLLQDWKKVFANTGVSYRIFLIDDGSKDKSYSILQTLQEKDPTLIVHTQPNAGHGPAILKGYRMALNAKAEWIFQIDSDHQLEVTAFEKLWQQKEQYDLLLGQRVEKNASILRQYISRASRSIVGLLYGREVRDVNIPYRLMRAKNLSLALEKIPSNAFAPNILLTSWFVLKKNRIFTTAVSMRKEGPARPSIMNAYFFRGALKAAGQALVFRIKI